MSRLTLKDYPEFPSGELTEEQWTNWCAEIDSFNEKYDKQCKEDKNSQVRRFLNQRISFLTQSFQSYVFGQMTSDSLIKKLSQTSQDLISFLRKINKETPFPGDSLDERKRIIDISYLKRLSHIGSCLSAHPIIHHIYQTKKENDLFVLSSGHAALALYVVLEGKYGHDAEKLFDLHGVHPNRDLEHNIHCSSGSLGQGLPIALGMALSDRSKEVYCLISDGECAEGSIWESLRIASDLKVKNLKIFVNANGFGAYDKVDTKKLIRRLESFDFPLTICTGSQPDVDFLSGLKAHYHTMSEEDYNSLNDKWAKGHSIEMIKI